MPIGVAKPHRSRPAGVSGHPVQPCQASDDQPVAASWTVTGATIEISDVEADDEVEFVEHDGIVDHGRDIAIPGPGCSANGSTLIEPCSSVTAPHEAAWLVFQATRSPTCQTIAAWALAASWTVMSVTIEIDDLVDDRRWSSSSSVHYHRFQPHQVRALQRSVASFLLTVTGGMMIGAGVLVEAATTRAEFVEHQSVVLDVVSHGRARPRRSFVHGARRSGERWAGDDGAPWVSSIMPSPIIDDP